MEKRNSLICLFGILASVTSFVIAFFAFNAVELGIYSNEKLFIKIGIIEPEGLHFINLFSIFASLITTAGIVGIIGSIIYTKKKKIGSILFIVSTIFVFLFPLALAIYPDVSILKKAIHFIPFVLFILTTILSFVFSSDKFQGDAFDKIYKPYDQRTAEIQQQRQQKLTHDSNDYDAG